MAAGGITTSVACWKKSAVGTAAVQEVYDAGRMVILQGLCFSTAWRQLINVDHLNLDLDSKLITLG